MDKSFDPTHLEQRWYQEWETRGYFSPRDAGDSYCIMLPPPNVTGRLHMGHAFQDTLMDALVRYKRMSGYSTLWQGGTDHAGIATQMVVERQLAAEGKSRHDLGREAFVAAVWDWKEHSGGTIQSQLRRLGASLDWDNERFTMDEGLSQAVARVFVTLFEEGLIYRGKRLVNWDPVLHTALSDLEVESHEESGHLWHIRYPRVDGNGHVVVATTRPETLLGDSAVAVHPEDERYADLIGLEVELPLTGRRIPVIADDYVDPEFGSGCVKITPAHDFNDYEVGQRHDLEQINVLTPDARINDAAPKAYRGMDRYEARRAIVRDLEAADLLARTQDHALTVPRGDRSGAVLEPMLTDQWFVRIEPLARPAIDAVESGRIRFVPENWAKTYFDWMYNIQDWCISRQLWWGHRIPAWYDSEGNIYVGLDEADARRRSGLTGDTDLRQDEDVLDTWFSSALFPFSTLGWPDRSERLATYYPTDVLVTGFDIIFFWVARMIMMGLKFMDEVPFHTVYIHGLIRDSQGHKMSKSRGNTLDPLDLIDGISLDDLVAKRTQALMQPKMAPAIEKATRREFPDGIKAYGTDALRFTFAALATTGRDIRLDTGRIEGYRNFCNKLWNAARFVLMNCAEDAPTEAGPGDPAARWIVHRLSEVSAEVAEYYAAYRFDLMAQCIYDFVWHDYCDWYLELAKPALRDADRAPATRYALLRVLEAILRLLHPLMPFITEEIWQQVADRIGIEGDTIMHQPFPQAGDFQRDSAAVQDLAWMQAVINGIRQIRGEMNLEPGRSLPLMLQGGEQEDRQRMARFEDDIRFLARVEAPQWLSGDEEAPESAVSLAGPLKLMVPMAGLIDKNAEIERLNKAISQREQDVKRAEGKLANKKFVANAPAAVVDKERAKLAEAQAALGELREQMDKLNRL